MYTNTYATQNSVLTYLIFKVSCFDITILSLDRSNSIKF